MIVITSPKTREIPTGVTFPLLMAFTITAPHPVNTRMKVLITSATSCAQSHHIWELNACAMVTMNFANRNRGCQSPHICVYIFICIHFFFLREYLAAWGQHLLLQRNTWPVQWDGNIVRTRRCGSLDNHERLVTIPAGVLRNFVAQCHRWIFFCRERCGHAELNLCHFVDLMRTSGWKTWRVLSRVCGYRFKRILLCKSFRYIMIDDETQSLSLIVSTRVNHTNSQYLQGREWNSDLEIH